MLEIAEQLSLPLFEPPLFDEIVKQENLIDLKVTLSGRLRRRWYITCNPWNRTRNLVIPKGYEKAPAPVKKALIQWAEIALKSKRNKSALQIRRSLEKVILAYSFENEPFARRPNLIDPDSFNAATQGAVFDLLEIFDEVNRVCFNGSVKSKVRWGQYASTTSYQTNKKDLAGNLFSLITIAGVYNHPAVPRFAIEAVMHHEMLHVVMPPTVRNGRRSVHPRAFSDIEKKFQHFKAWHLWEREWLHKLAREMRRKHKKAGLLARLKRAA